MRRISKNNSDLLLMDAIPVWQFVVSVYGQPVKMLNVYDELQNAADRITLVNTTSFQLWNLLS